MTSTYRYRSLLVVCAFLTTHGTIAQETAGQAVELTEDVQANIFAPFVSGLRTAVRDSQVRLVWRDARDYAGKAYRVLRSRSDIVSTNLYDAEVIAEVPSGVETYLDTPSRTGRYFYAVVAIRDDGRPYPILIPFRNKTIQPILITQSRTEEEPAVHVYGLTALPVGRLVELRFEVSSDDRNLSVYRSTRPFALSSDFERALLVGSIDDGARSWSDEPLPDIDYYYAVVDTTMVQLGSVTPLAGQNTLADPVRIVLGRPTAQAPNRIRRLRPTPLPVLRVATSADGANRLARNPVPTPAGPLQPATQDAVAELLARVPEERSERSSRLEPVVLPQHRVVDGRGAFRTLTQIVTTEFTRGDWALTAESLRNLIRTPLYDTLEREARFYLGQALYFDGQAQRAFMEFLLAGNGELYPESQIWINTILHSYS